MKLAEFPIPPPDDHVCRMCGEPIEWPGICEACNEEMMAETVGEITTEDKLKASGVPAGYLGFTWERSPIDSDIIQKIKDWAGVPPIIVLIGPTGRGKTAAALCRVKDAVEVGHPVRWIYVPDWLDELRYLERGDGSWLELQSVSRSKSVVVLDELVTRRLTEYGIDRLLQVIDARQRELLPTIITTNLPVFGKKSVATVDERLASRVSAGLVITILGEDQRRQG